MFEIISVIRYPSLTSFFVLSLLISASTLVESTLDNTSDGNDDDDDDDDAKDEKGEERRLFAELALGLLVEYTPCWPLLPTKD